MTSSKPTLLTPGSADYPNGLAAFLGEPLPTITAVGELDILHRPLLALLCSVRCPGTVILRTYDLARALRAAGRTVIGGFQSPMERECLELLLRGRQPAILCPARAVRTMRLPDALRGPLAEGRLLLLSPFEPGVRRVTAQTALRRNEFVAALAQEVVVAYADPGGKTEALCQRLARAGKPLLTFDLPENANLLALGARVVRAEDFPAESGEPTPLEQAAGRHS